MKVSALEIFETFSPDGLLTEMDGPDVVVSGVAPVESCGPGELVFVDRGDVVDLVRSRNPAVVVTSPKLRESFAEGSGPTLLLSGNVKLAHALIRQRWADRDVLASEWPEAVHPSAVVHESCEIGAGSRIGPQVVLGAHVRVGSDTAILAGAVVESGAVIGDRCVIHPNATIGYDCELGDEVIVQSGAVVGAEGYGFAQDPKGRSHRIPQTGRVVIEEGVSIGAGCCIDRATYGETRVGAGTKLDNLCHIAHNVQIGRDCLLTAGFVVAGSTKIGDRVVASGQTGVLDHMEICNDVVLLHRAGVTQNIEEPGMYAGTPIQPLSAYMKNVAMARKLGEVRKKLRQLEREIGELSSRPE